MFGPLAEIAPAAPAIGELAALLALLTALGLILCLHAFVTGLFWVAGRFIDTAVGWIPWVGKKAKGGLLAVESRVNGALDQVVAGLEVSVAATWHVLGDTIQWTGHVIAESARATAALFWYVHVKFPLHVIHAGVHALQRAVTVVEHTTTVVTRKVTYTTKVLTHPRSGPIASGVKWGTRTIEANLEDLNKWARAQIKWIALAAAVTIPGQLGLLGWNVRELWRALRRALRWAKKHERLLGAAGFSALMIHALAKVGAGWLRCDNVRNAGRRLCGMDKNALENLLGLTVSLVGLLAIIPFAKELQDIVEVETEAIHKLIRKPKPTAPAP